MKKSVFIFIFVALLILAISPVINLIVLDKMKTETKWWKKRILYNFDFSLPVFNYCFYQLGISTDPNQVITGKDDWLYLGDQYRQTLTFTRHGATNEYTETSKKINVATKAWNQWLKGKGVRQYQIMIAPNKSTIYPEFLPDWMQPTENSVIDTLLTNVSQELYIDTRSALKKAKSQFSTPLYYKTDTHWNNLGAWIAFHAFTTEISRTNTELHWISEQQIRLLTVNKRSGGDLGAFLKISKSLQDKEPIIDIVNQMPIETEQYNFETGSLTTSGGNPQVALQTNKSPILVKSKYALNDKKILWIHDSFGIALAPFMAATFRETLQLHYIETSSAQFAKLVETYRPDYVFITVVERDAIDPWFQNLPPL